MQYTLRCLKCRESIPTDSWVWRHDICGAPLTIEYRYQENFENLVDPSASGLLVFHKLLPISRPTYYPPLTAGNTPVVKRFIEGVEVVFKLEYLNPAGSFKDRGAYVAIGRARELGLKSIIIDSSGNSGIAHALFGRVSGINVHIYVPDYTPEGKRSLLELLGANLHIVPGDRMEVNRAALLGEKRGLGAYVGHWWNPYFIEGVKTISFETHIKVGQVDSVIALTGSGTLLLGLAKGYKELKTLGEIDEVPRLIAVQACGYAELCSKIKPVKCDARTELADGIMIKHPPRIEELIEAVKTSNGDCIIVEDNEIIAALKQLLKMGFIVEPTSAAALAAFKKAVKEGIIEKGEKTLLPLTGTGFKMVKKLKSIVTK